MLLRELRLKDFRNYEELTLSFEKGANIFFGSNGQGKTNLLEAISLLSVGRSFRTTRDADMIAFGREDANVIADTCSDKGEYSIDIKLGKKIKKAVKINSIPIDKLQELFGVINVVVFSPDDLKLIKDGPKERRLFLDREISQIRPRYYRVLSDYYKVLQRRNLLLKEEGPSMMVDIYTEQLAQFGYEVMDMRRTFLEEICTIAKDIHRTISSGKEELNVEYEANVSASTSQEYLDVLRDAKEQDVLKGNTTRGIHRDDIALKIGEMDIRHFGSQGQKRSAAISLKLSEIALMHQLFDEYPIVLLDDIFSELDPSRQKMLLEYVKDTQVFLTTAEPFEFEGRVFRVEEGRIVHMERGLKEDSIVE
ncbi:MAG: DNA replication/repair protein RecF [Filifactor alocis]|nr:DNA replication/repair protein RecF [Filifactor alocis]